MSKMRFLQRKFAFFIFVFFMLETEKQKEAKNKMEKAPKPIKIVFLRWSSETEIFLENCLTLFVSGREKNAHFRACYLFWPNFFWTKAVKTRKNYKNSGFNGNCPKPKMTHVFLKKVFCDMGEKVGFTNCVFEKLCSSENTIFIVLSANTAVPIKSCILEKSRKFMRNSGLF